MAEWMQAQWKQNLGITDRPAKHGVEDVFGRQAKLEYKGFRVAELGAPTTWIRSRS